MAQLYILGEWERFHFKGRICDSQIREACRSTHCPRNFAFKHLQNSSQYSDRALKKKKTREFLFVKIQQALQSHMLYILLKAL